MTPSCPFQLHPFCNSVKEAENPSMEEGGRLEVIDKDLLPKILEEYVTASGSMRSPKLKWLQGEGKLVYVAALFE